MTPKNKVSKSYNLGGMNMGISKNKVEKENEFIRLLQGYRFWIGLFVGFTIMAIIMWLLMWIGLTDIVKNLHIGSIQISLNETRMVETMMRYVK